MEVGIPNLMPCLLSIVRGYKLESQLCDRGKLFKVPIIFTDSMILGKGGKECQRYLKTD
jgi:hypothetical protein